MQQAVALDGREQGLQFRQPGVEGLGGMLIVHGHRQTGQARRGFALVVADLLEQVGRRLQRRFGARHVARLVLRLANAGQQFGLQQGLVAQAHLCLLPALLEQLHRAQLHTAQSIGCGFGKKFEQEVARRRGPRRFAPRRRALNDGHRAGC